MPKPRTKLQNKAIHALLNKHGIDAELKAEMVTRLTKGRTSHTSAMYFHEANQLITELGGEAVDASLRTKQLHRQQAGVVQLATLSQMKHLEELALSRWGDSWGQPLARLCLRMIRKSLPRTTAEANKLIEAIKAMNARDQTKEAA